MTIPRWDPGLKKKRGYERNSGINGNILKHSIHIRYSWNSINFLRCENVIIVKYENAFIVLRDMLRYLGVKNLDAYNQFSNGSAKTSNKHTYMHTYECVQIYLTTHKCRQLLIISQSRETEYRCSLYSFLNFSLGLKIFYFFCKKLQKN